MENKKIMIPADVPESMKQEYSKNYRAITNDAGRLFLFAVDHKIEHLDPHDPNHFFEIASQGQIGAFATQLGLIARYAHEYKNINYIVKLNSKTNLVPTEQHDPMSSMLWSVSDVLEFKKNSGASIGTHIRGVGYTIYLGSIYESQMLAQAAQIVYQAHQHGLVAILWIYPRGVAIKQDGADAAQLCAGAAGVGVALGADFVKIKAPSDINNISNMNALRRAVVSAGNTKVICAGGIVRDSEQFLRDLREQVYTGNSSGCAVGRNIFEKSVPDAIAFTKAISAVLE